MPGRRLVRTCAALLAVLIAPRLVPPAGAGLAHGQEPPDDGAATAAADEPGGDVLSGQVLIGDLPADSGTVVLHHVSRQFSGEIDSVRVGTGGFFEIPLPEVSGDGTGDVFFATIRYQNVLYVGEAITAPPPVEGTYLIQAYPTVPAGPEAVPRVRIRNLFAERLDPGPGWAVVDYFELDNGVRATLVASEHGPAWSHALPPDATGFQVGSDLSAGMASFSDGRVHVSAPVRPGENLFQFRYTIPTERFTVPLEGTTGSMELLIREPAGELTVSGLVNVPEVEIEGTWYRRFAGRDVAPSVVTVAQGGTGGPLGSMPLAAILLTLVLAGAGALVAARSQAVRRRGSAAPTRRDVLLEIARLDEERKAGRVPEDAYERRRARLIKELKA